MLRINLLPPYIYDKQKKVKLAAFWGLLIAAALGGFLLWFVSLNNAWKDEHDKQVAAEGYRDQYIAVESDINKEKQRRQDIENRQTFIANAQKYNDSWPAAFEVMRDVTANDILLKSMSFDKSRKVVSFTGFAKDEGTIVRWWEYLRNNYAGPDASLPFDNVAFSLPGHPWPPKIDANGPGGKNENGGSFGPMAGSAGPGGGGSFGPMAGSGGPGSGGFGGSFGPGNPGGGRGGRGGSKDEVGPAIIDNRPGINFAATITLKKPLADGIATPVWTGGGAAPAAPAGFGGGAPGPGGIPGSGGGPMTGGPMSGGGPAGRGKAD